MRFGRHPDCEISFDATRDIDASSRHAELRPPAEGVDAWMLVDVGSSNGTFVDGKRITEAPIAVGHPVMVEFGPAGPSLRLFVGDEAAAALLTAPPAPAVKKPFPMVWIVAAALLAAGAVVVLLLL